MKKIKIGVFGAGRGSCMIDVLFSHPEAEIVAVCDKYAPLLDGVRKKAEEKGVSVALYEDFEDFIQCDMDAVILANYANEHAPYAIRLLRSGRHVMSECLTCASMAQAVELIEAVEESGKVYSYAENYSYSLTTFEMQRCYENGDIGEVMYAEGEYIHDCSGEWPRLAYGDPDHWRNQGYSTFYCTHGIAPIMTITGQRPVRVTGYETICADYTLGCGMKGATAGLIVMQMDNGAIARFVDGNLRHNEPNHINSSYRIFGNKGELRSSMSVPNTIHAYTVGQEQKTYAPEPQFEADFVKKFASHGGADFFPTHLFIEKILGKEVGKRYSIDVYQAVDMCICGILAYRSILNGNIPIEVPNLRDPAQRDKYRNDHACTTPSEAGDQMLPHNSHGIVDIPASVYEEQKKLWLESQK